MLVWREGFDPRDAYVGIKAGDIPHFNHHCHMDFGNLVVHAEGRELLARGVALFYDTRSLEEYRALHIAGALPFPDAEMIARFGDLPTDETLVFY